jgi:hypothetical protein
MILKGIAAFFLLIAAAVAAPAIEQTILLTPAGGATRLSGAAAGTPGTVPLSPASATSVRDPILGGWLSDNAVAVPGFRGGTDFVLAPAAYRLGADTDLLMHFDGQAPADETGRWAVGAGRAFSVDGAKAAIGRGAASFKGPSSALSLEPGRGSLLERGSRFRDFTIEFWLYPASAENGEVILSWQSQRTQVAVSGAQAQSLVCAITGGRLSWVFQGFFEKPGAFGAGGAAGAGTAAGGRAATGGAGAAAGSAAASRLELRASAPLVPRTWSHHLIRFDGDTGLLEYLVNGVTEATAYATSTGHEGRGADVYAPAIGAAAPLVLGADYSGLVDEFRVSRSFVSGPALAPYGRDPGLVLSPVADLGFGNSRLASVDVVSKTPGNTGIELSYRISDEWVGWSLASPEWQPLRPGERLPETARGRYVQVRAELYPDGTGRVSPSLSSITLHYEADPPPPPPAKLIAIAHNGSVELVWSRVPEADVAGYLVYYGDAPGEYFGTAAAAGPSPLDAGNVLSCTVTGLPNGSLVYFVVAAYDKAAPPGNPALRAGLFSMEAAARPLRTAQ